VKVSSKNLPLENCGNIFQAMSVFIWVGQF